MKKLLMFFLLTVMAVFAVDLGSKKSNLNLEKLEKIFNKNLPPVVQKAAFKHSHIRHLVEKNNVKILQKGIEGSFSEITSDFISHLSEKELAQLESILTYSTVEAFLDMRGGGEWFAESYDEYVVGETAGEAGEIESYSEGEDWYVYSEMTDIMTDDSQYISSYTHSESESCEIDDYMEHYSDENGGYDYEEVSVDSEDGVGFYINYYEYDEEGNVVDSYHEEVWIENDNEGENEGSDDSSYPQIDDDFSDLPEKEEGEGIIYETEGRKPGLGVVPFVKIWHTLQKEGYVPIENPQMIEKDGKIMFQIKVKKPEWFLFFPMGEKEFIVEIDENGEILEIQPG